MKHSLGPRWRDWGTEQSGSNFAISNAPGTTILPYPEYATFPLKSSYDRSKFLHYIGSNRYDHGHFAREGQRVIHELLGR